MHHMARQGAADDALGQSRCLDQRLQVDPGFDSKFLANDSHVRGEDIAGRADVLVARERTTARPYGGRHGHWDRRRGA